MANQTAFIFINLTLIEGLPGGMVIKDFSGQSSQYSKYFEYWYFDFLQ